MDHFSFVLLHLVHLALVAWLFRGRDWVWFISVTATLLGATTIICFVPQYLQRPLALLLYSTVLLLPAAEPKQLPWFFPLFFLKLLISHLIDETPFTPDDDERIPLVQ